MSVERFVAIVITLPVRSVGIETDTKYSNRVIGIDGALHTFWFGFFFFTSEIIVHFIGMGHYVVYMCVCACNFVEKLKVVIYMKHISATFSFIIGMKTN